jgi:uncharacterized protein (TIGR03382 family)
LKSISLLVETSQIKFVHILLKPMEKNTIPNNSMLGKSLLAVVVGAGMAFSAASAATIVVDAVPTDVDASIDRTIDSGVTVTSGGGLFISNNANQDPNMSGWDGNAYLYRTGTSGPGSVTYAAPSGGYFTDFGAQVMVHKGNVGSTWTAASARFIFESSTDGTNFTTITVSGTYANLGGAGIADWAHFDVSTTDPSSLTDVTHLRVTVQTGTGQSWEAAIASSTMEVIPEPSTALLGGLGLLALLRRRRD